MEEQTKAKRPVGRPRLTDAERHSRMLERGKVESDKYTPPQWVVDALKAPVLSRYDPEHHTIGYVVDFCAPADMGKTLGVVCTIIYLITECGYDPSEVWTNFPLYIPGVHRLDNTMLRFKIGEMTKMNTRHQIFAMDEVDSIYPARYWQNKKHTDELLKLWQATKLENWVLGTEHEGSGLNKLWRESVQIMITPTLYRSNDVLHLEIIDAVDLNPRVVREVENVSRFYGMYDRWQPTT